MTDDLSPGDIRARKFSSSRRGYNRSEVSEFLDRVASRTNRLEAELSVVEERLNQLGITNLPDLKAEIEDVGIEIQTVIDASMAAAEGFRTRASADADELMVEADRASRALRGDAWEAGSDLLEQADAYTRQAIAEAREASLFIRAEAEQDAKRLVSDARREADEMIRSSREEGERIVVIAKAESESVLEGARQAADKAQERARALENRRSELLTELESAEAAKREIEKVRAMHGTPTDATGVRVIAAGSDGRTHWPADEGTVRILPADPVLTDEPVDAEQMAAEVEEMRASVTMPQAVVEVDIREEVKPDVTVASDDDAAGTPEVKLGAVVAEEPAVEAEPDAALEDDGAEPTSDEEPLVEERLVEEPVSEETAPEEPEEPPVAPAAGPREKVTIVTNDAGVDALFAKLRHPVTEPVAVEVAEEPAEEPLLPVLRAVPDLEVGEAFGRRDRTLLPVENRGLRGLKRRIVELQNRVLEEIRTSSGEWRLGREFVVEMMGDEMDAVLQDSFSAGHAAAAESLGVDEPQLTGGPEQGAAEDFTVDLHRDVHAVMERGSGLASRRLASDVGRVFRSWRTDEAERHVRQAARRAYNDGLLAGYERLEVPAVEAVAPGRPCGQCGAGTGTTWRPGGSIPASVVLPPAGPGCAAMIVAAGSAGFDSRHEQ